MKMLMPRKKPDIRHMKISQAAQLAGVSKQTVEYYVLIGLIRPSRGEGGGRFFDDGMVQRIKLIRKLNDSGYTLRDIKQTYLKRR